LSSHSQPSFGKKLKEYSSEIAKNSDNNSAEFLFPSLLLGSSAAPRGVLK